MFVLAQRNCGRTWPLIIVFFHRSRRRHSASSHHRVQMERNIFGRVTEIPSRYQLDLTGSISPFLYSLRMFSIDLDVGQPRSKLRRFVFFAFRLASIAVIIATAIFIMNYSTSKKSGNSKYWFNILNNFIWGTSTMVFQLAVLAATSFRWKPLWNQMEQMERILILPVPFLGQLRKVSAMCLMTIFIAVRNSPLH